MQILRKISSLTLILVMLASTTGFSMGVHFCMGELQSLAFFKNASPCETMAQAVSLCHQETILKQKGCCEDKTLSHDAQDNLAKAPAPQEIHPDLKYAVPVITTFILTPALHEKLIRQHFSTIPLH